MSEQDRPDAAGQHPPEPAHGDAFWEPTGPHRPPLASRPDFTGPVFPAPSGVPELLPRAAYTTQLDPTGPAPTGSNRSATARPTRVAAVVLTALLVGGMAGLGGGYAARWLPGTTEPGAGSTPTPAPTTSDRPTGASEGPSSGAPPSATDTVAIAKKVLPSTVVVRVHSGNRSGTGSGFVIDATNGYVLTNNHVVELGAASGGQIAVLLDDQTTATARIVGRSPSYDVAVLKITARRALTQVEVGYASSVQVGQTVIAFGAPLGLGGTVTQGIISATGRPVAVGADGSDPDAPTAYIDALQTDAPINPGNSGGPLVDANGRVIGVNSAILTLGGGSTPTGNIGLGFAIPVDQAMTIAEQLIDTGVATYPVVGAEMADTSRGVRVGAIGSGGPAAKAGLKGDDVIMTIDGRPVTSAVQLTVQIRTHRPGETVVLGFRRGATTMQARVTLGAKEG